MPDDKGGGLEYTTRAFRKNMAALHDQTGPFSFNMVSITLQGFAESAAPRPVKFSFACFFAPVRGLIVQTLFMGPPMFHF